MSTMDPDEGAQPDEEREATDDDSDEREASPQPNQPERPAWN
jgi:hypothetical protein